MAEGKGNPNGVEKLLWELLTILCTWLLTRLTSRKEQDGR